MPANAGIHGFVMSRSYYVYLMSNKRNGILYAGVTGNLPRRVFEHKEGLVDGFSKKYGLKLLVYYEECPTAQEAIQAEKRMKKWKRAWKVRKIHSMNPDWKDLSESLN